jgi:hypothetical protein
VDTVLRELLESDLPSIRYGARLFLLCEDPRNPAMLALQEQIRSCEPVKCLLSKQNESRQIPGQCYSKWIGAHWILANLADLHYPPGDTRLVPLHEQQLDFFFTKDMRPARKVIIVKGQPRMCASIEANGLFSALALGIENKRTLKIFDLLLEWRWPDGGWNCDKNASASHSSFMETLIPLRAVNRYYQRTSDPRALTVIEKAAEVFLRHRLFRRVSDGQVMNPHFVQLHYPLYWHYDILGALKVMAEIGKIDDPRCSEALDLLESKRLPEGGYPAEESYYSTSSTAKSGRSLVNWGGVNRRRMNPWVALDALTVLKAAGRYSIDW